MLENTNVSFKIGENASESSPPIVPGQFLVDAAADKQCLYLDTDESTRIQLKDPTKMDKWGEVHSLDSITYIEPSTSIILGYGAPSSGTPATIRGLRVDEEEDGQIALMHMDTSDSSYSTMVSHSLGPSGVTSMYYSTENGTAQVMAGYSSLSLVAEIRAAYDRSSVHHEHRFGASSNNSAFAVVNSSYPVGNMQARSTSQLLMDTDSLSLTYIPQASTARKISFHPDTDTEQFLIHGVCNPKEDMDAANKKYVDSKVSELQTTWIDW